MSTFKVSRDKDSSEVEVPYVWPASTTDPKWNKLGYTAADLNAAAIRSARIDLQGYLRRNWPTGKTGDSLRSALEVLAKGWTRSAKSAAPTVTIDLNVAPFNTFSEEQVAGLRASGAVIVEKQK